MTGKSVPFSIEQDGYIRVRLEDGSELRARPVIVDVQSTDEQGPRGEPVYMVHAFVHIVLEKWTGSPEGEKKGVAQ